MHGALQRLDTSRAKRDRRDDEGQPQQHQVPGLQTRPSASGRPIRIEVKAIAGIV
jgi:hypothetical protein